MKILNFKPVELSADTSDPKALDLTLLGVPENLVSLQPTATRFPTSFSNESSQIWSKMFSNEDSLAQIRSGISIGEQWKLAFRLFMNLCDENGVSPFSSQRNRVDNSSLISFLKTSRIRLVQFLNESHMLTVLRIVRGKQVRKYDVGHSKFEVNVSALVRSPFRTMSDLEKYLFGLKFVRSQNSSYKRRITPNCVIYVNAQFINRLKVSYFIKGNQSLFMGTKFDLPTQRQVQSFADTIIFLPLIRSHRVRSIGNTLF